MNRTIITVLLAAAFAALMLQPLDVDAQEQVIYKWLDAEGVVHYTARPPDDVDYTIVDLETREPVENDAADGQDRDADESVSDDTTQPPETAQAGPNEEEMAERCEQARSNIEALNRYQNVTVEGEDGEQRTISDEERMNMLEEAQQFIDEWC